MTIFKLDKVVIFGKFDNIAVKYVDAFKKVFKPDYFSKYPKFLIMFHNLMCVCACVCLCFIFCIQQINPLVKWSRCTVEKKSSKSPLFYSEVLEHTFLHFLSLHMSPSQIQTSTETTPCTWYVLHPMVRFGSKPISLAFPMICSVTQVRTLSSVSVGYYAL